MSGALQVNHLFAEITEPSPPKANLWLILGLCLQTLICAEADLVTAARKTSLSSRAADPYAGRRSGDAAG